MRSEAVLDDIARLDAEDHITLQMWLAHNEICDDVCADHLFVNRVGLDVFTVETHARIGGAHALQRVDETARTRRRSDLRRREMADGRAAKRAVQTEQ